MHTTYQQVEYIKLQDNFFNDTGIEVAQFLDQIEKAGMKNDERLQKITADEY